MPQRSPGPSVKDKELYEKLRDEGNSKQKSARIANAAAKSGRSAVGRRGCRRRLKTDPLATAENGPPRPR
jgi:hypothetical protein